MKNQNHIAPALVAGAVKLAPKVGKVVKKVAETGKKVLTNIKKDSDKLFLADRNDVAEILNNAGYKKSEKGGLPNAPSFTEFKIKNEQVSGKSPDYKYAYERLQKWIAKMLNTYNPGLGDKYILENPVVMRSFKNVSHDWINFIRQFVALYPANVKFVPTFTDLAKSVTTPTEISKTETEEPDLIKPLTPVFVAGLLAQGDIPKIGQGSDIIAEQFYNSIVAPSTGNFQSENLDKAVQNSILSFIATVTESYQSGEQQNPVFKAIGKASTALQTKLETQVKETAGNTLGNWIIKNPVPSLGIAVLLGIVVVKVFK